MPLDWVCESIRLSLFSTGGVQIDGSDWTNLTGQAEAEKEQKVAGRRFFASDLMGGQLALSAIANRCDCILSPTPKADEISEGYIPSVGQWPSCLGDFQKATETYLPRFGVPVTRMAFGVTLLNLHKERIGAYRALTGQLKSVTRAPEEMRDLVFRINWPKNSTADNSLTINRLTTWQVQQMQLQVVVTDGISPTTYPNPITYLVRLELDHNTDAAHTQPFDVDRLVPIYRDLTNLALQNAEEGEVL